MPRAALHSFRRLPPSPDHDSPHIPSLSLSVDPAADRDMTSATGHYLGATPERIRVQSRTTSTLPYQNSGARDLHDHSRSRNPRNLLVVIPPPDLPLDQGHLGNVLSMGPRNRLSQGILIPLFSSMFGQLNAIAREYNFPSTVGLCLYLHINENGVTMTPRISDDSWQHLFGHLFDGRPPSGGRQLPIGGSVEFDIDLNKARWFDTWVSGTLQGSDPVFPPVVPSRSSLEAHWRGESQTINVDEQPVEDRWDGSGPHAPVINSRPETLRHLPKKLSLLDRLELYGVHVPLKSQNHPDHPDSPPTHRSHASSPILPSAVPPAATNDLERRVNSWRATTELHPVSMTETYQPAPDAGVSAGVTIMDEALQRNFRQPVAIDEFLWSVTSAGPRSPAVESPIASSRPSSVHLDRRANGSVPLTPTTVTSWGPTDDEGHSVVSSVTRLPSPDMGERMVEDVMAPRPCAVWGNSFGWRSAMTWKEVYPYSFIQTRPTIQVQPQDSSDLVPQYPNLVIYPTVGSHFDTQPPSNIFKRLKSSPQQVWGSSFGWQRAVTWRKVYPYSMVKAQSVAPIQLRGAGGLESKYPNLCIYPAIYPYSEIYPACTIEEDVDIPRPVSEMLIESDNLTCCPSLVIYPAVYPHLDIHPSVVDGVEMKELSQVDTNIYSLGGVSTLYPNLVIYPTVYPHFDLYPNTLQVTKTPKWKEIDARSGNAGCLTAEYPRMSICPLTTRRHVGDQSRSISRSGTESPPITNHVVGKQGVWGSSFGWKSATTWRAVWPTPYARTRANVSLISVRLGRQDDSSSNYPHLIIYPAAYPHFDIYPSVPRSVLSDRRIQGSVLSTPSTATTWGPQDDDLYPEINSIQCLLSPDLGQRILDDIENAEFSHQPWRMVWPFFGNMSQVETISLVFEKSVFVPEYPHLAVHPPAYSHFEFHPTTLKNQVTETLANSTTHPALDIYKLNARASFLRSYSPLAHPDPAVYPLPSIFSNIRHERVDVRLPSLYPNFDVYPACYPYNLDYIYPFINASESTQIPIKVSRAYPCYPPVYPFIIPYPGLSAEVNQPFKPEQSLHTSRPTEWKSVDVKLPIHYPLLDIYSAGYPWSLESIYPAVSIDDSCIWILPRVSSPSSTYTHMRTTSARLSKAVKFVMPRRQRRNSSATPGSPLPGDHKDRAKDRQSPMGFLSLVDRRPTAVPPLPHTNTSELLSRAPRSSQTKDSLVSQRARAYEQFTAVNQSSSAVGTKGTHSPFMLVPMTEVAEAIEKSKTTFP